MKAPTRFSCSCGSVRGEIEASTLKSGTRIRCHCDDCRAFQIAVGRPDPGRADGVDIVHIAPAGMRVETGQDQLAALRLSPRGNIRWYAKCCGTPIAVTLRTKAVPFAGLLTDILETTDGLKKVRVVGFLRDAQGQTYHKNARSIATGILSRTVSAYLSGTAKKTPFRSSETGEWLELPELLAQDRKDEIYQNL